MSGLGFLTEQAHHINFFAMGPALNYVHGKAFGTEFYSQYGIGWAFFFSVLHKYSAMTYGNWYGLEIIYACVYYLGIFWLLRICFGQSLWAAIGTILALYVQLFCGVAAGDYIWQFPSSTMMRHPMDVWFFIILAARWPIRRTLRHGLAGMAVAGAVFFETETGVYLAVTFFIYLLLQAGTPTHRMGLKTLGTSIAAFGSGLVLVLFPLLFWASRGTMFSGNFWHGWLESLTRYGVYGLSALPMAEAGEVSIVIFLLMVLTYLGAGSYILIKTLHGRATESETLVAAAAFYGLGLILLFVNRSHPFNLCHVAVPFTVILTTLLFHGFRSLPHPLPQSKLPLVLAGGLIAMVVATPTFQFYPSLTGSAYFKPPAHDGLSLISQPVDLSGLPDTAEAYASEFKRLASALKKIGGKGNDIAVLDSLDTVIYYAAGLKPWSRYTPCFDLIITKKIMTNLLGELTLNAPAFIVIRGERAAREIKWESIWNPLYQNVKSNYVIYGSVGSYEIWRNPKISPDLTLAAAQNLIGFQYAQGVGRERDYAASIPWFRQAADQGDSDAQYNLGLLYEAGLGISRDLAAATSWYQRAADQGHVLAQNSLGLLNFNLKNNQVAAAKWFRRAANQGNPAAANSLGVIYLQGLGTKPDIQEAAKWFQLAAQNGFADAQNNLGLLLVNQQRVVEAAQWFHKAADLGHSVAQCNLAQFYQNGIAYPLDPAEAVLWYTRSAKQGYATAQLELGKIYQSGRGVKPDKVEAYKWFKLAELQGSADAHSAVTNCMAVMSPEELKAAEIELNKLRNGG